ncbi:MAG: hypothetical protein AAFV88_02165 [Planctomycetota bacterium]
MRPQNPSTFPRKFMDTKGLQHGRSAFRNLKRSVQSIGFLVFALVSPFCTPAPAQFIQLIDGSKQIQFPTQSALTTGTAAAGLAADVTFDAIVSPGSIGVELTFRALQGPSTRQRRFTFRATPIELHLDARNAVIGEFNFELDQGSQSVTVKRTLPKWSYGDGYRLEILEDGATLPGFLFEVRSSIQSTQVVNPTNLMIQEYYNYVVEVRRSQDPEAAPKVFQLLLDDVPDDWRLIRNLNTILMRHEELTAILQDTSAAAKVDSIRHWVLMGGTLLVTGAPERSQLSTELRLSLQKPKREFFTSRVNSVQREWNSRIKEYDYSVNNPSSSARPEFLPAELGGRLAPDTAKLGSSPSWREGLASDVATVKQEASAFQETWSQGYLCAVGMGLVLGVPGKEIGNDMAPPLIDSLLDERVSALLLRGVDPVVGDARFRRWLIPGVAQPPVYTFIGILTLFVVLVGPIAYRSTTRAHRSHLMFIIAPVLAILTTVAMFTYGIVADGFETVSRVRQITWIDGASGDAIERTRATLFAGLTPREGLQFDGNAEVMMYPNNYQTEWESLPYEASDTNRPRVYLEGDRQRLSASTLPARSQTQFISHRVRDSLGSVSFTKIPDFTSDEKLADEPASVRSTLPFAVERVVLRTDDGRFWSIENLPADSEVDAIPVPKIQDVSKRLGTLYNDHRPIGVSNGSSRSRKASVDLISLVNRQLRRTSAIQDGSFELTLSNNLSVRGEIDAGTFVGISDVSEDSIPVAGAEHVASVRYIMGTLE